MVSNVKNSNAMKIYSFQFMVGYGMVTAVAIYCVFVLISTSAIFEGEIKINTLNIQGANTFPWEQGHSALPLDRKSSKSKKISNDVVVDSGNKKPPTVKPVSFMLEQSRIQIQRRAQVAAVCMKNPKLDAGPISHDTLRHIYVHESTKLLYCFVPKVACSNWKRILMVLNGKKQSIDDITSSEAHFHNGMKRLVSYTIEQRSEMLRSYKKFMFVRNPFVRILSAYKNKYQDKNQYLKEKYFHRFAKRIMKKYRKNPSEHDLETGEGITWGEFIQYLTDPTQYAGFDDHWEEMYKLCSPCKINYDFIGKLETLRDDAKYILKSINADDKVSYPERDNSHPTNSTKEFDSYYRDLDSHVQQRLWEIYKLDFELFGYNKPTFVI